MEQVKGEEGEGRGGVGTEEKTAKMFKKKTLYYPDIFQFTSINEYHKTYYGK